MLKVEVGDHVVVVSWLVSSGEDVVSFMQYLRDLRESLLKLLLQVSSQFAVDLLPYFLS